VILLASVNSVNSVTDVPARGEIIEQPPPAIFTMNTDHLITVVQQTAVAHKPESMPLPLAHHVRVGPVQVLIVPPVTVTTRTTVFSKRSADQQKKTTIVPCSSRKIRGKNHESRLTQCSSDFKNFRLKQDLDLFSRVCTTKPRKAL